MSTIIAIAALALLAALFVAPYVFYGPLMKLFAVRGPAAGNDRPFALPEPENEEWPTVSVLIPAHNEAEVLRGKLNNCLNLDYPADKLEIIVCDDGSADNTAAIARDFDGRGVRLVQNAERSGKATALANLIGSASGELLVFTDASAMLRPDTVARLVHAARGENVGVACARYVVRGSRQGTDDSPEAGYWNVEARIRQAEAERDMLMGASGACYLIRRELAHAPAADTINDDYVIPLLARAADRRVAYVHDAIAWDSPTASPQTLYYRWVRIAFGNYQMLWRHKRLLWPGRPRIAFPLWRKLLRTLGPVFLLTGLLVTTLAALNEPLFLAPLGLAAAGIGAGLVALTLRESPVGDHILLKALRFGLLAQTGYLHGAGRFLLQRRKDLWRRPENDVLDLSRPAPLPLSVRACKRGSDLVMATIGLIVFSPVILIVAILVKLDSKGPVLYLQERERPGPDGEPTTFRMWKFRSMVTDAEKRSGPVWASQGGTDRVTRIGRVIRKYRIDELPQFVNVLKGEMSVVGPRPERPFFTRQLEETIPGYGDRISVVRPGITGWAQVQCPPDSNVDGVKFKVKHDLAYIANLYRFSSFVRIELRIIWRTVGVMLRGSAQ